MKTRSKTLEKPLEVDQSQSSSQSQPQIPPTDDDNVDFGTHSPRLKRARKVALEEATTENDIPLVQQKSLAEQIILMQADMPSERIHFTAEELLNYGLEEEWQKQVLDLPSKLFSWADKTEMYQSFSRGKFPPHRISEFVKSTKAKMDEHNTLEQKQSTLAFCLHQHLRKVSSIVTSSYSEVIEEQWLLELETARKVHLAVVSKFEDSCSTEDLVEQLSGGDQMLQLMLPATKRSNHAPAKEFSYVGRECLRDLLCTIAALDKGRLMSSMKLECKHHMKCTSMPWAKDEECCFTGTPGSGKSVLLATIAGLLLSQVKDFYTVYLLAEVYVSEPEPYDAIKRALLLSFANDLAICKEISLLQGGNRLRLWCSRKKGKFIYLIDERNAFDPARSTVLSMTEEKLRNLQTLLETFVEGNIVIWCSSINAKMVQAQKSYREVPYNYELNGSFSAQELEKWHENHSLPCDEDEFWYTGNVPRFLEIWHSELLKGNENFVFRFEGRLRSCVLSMVEHLKTCDGLMLKMFAKFLAERPVQQYELNSVPRDIFYIEKCQSRCLSPYLKNMGYKLLLEREVQDKEIQNLANLQVWLTALRLDCTLGTVNWPRLGWNAEAATILAICKHGFILDDHGRNVVTHRVIFGPGQEQEVMAEEHEEGTLFVPEQFNYHFVDVMYRKKLANSTWLLVGIQISISLYDTKARKKSHDRWMVHATAAYGAQNVDFKFLYMLRGSQQLVAEKFPSSYRNLKSGVKVVHAEYELCFATFGSVHSTLAWLDTFHLTQLVCASDDNAVECKTILKTGSRKGQECGRFFCKVRGHTPGTLEQHSSVQHI